MYYIYIKTSAHLLSQICIDSTMSEVLLYFYHINIVYILTLNTQMAEV
jgi:hypothetical protein